MIEIPVVNTVIESTPTIFSIEIIPIPIAPDLRFEKIMLIEDPHDAQNEYPQSRENDTKLH